MKRNHITVFYVHANGDKWVHPDESVIVFARAYGVNSVLVDVEWAELRFTPFAEMHLKRLTAEQRDGRHPSFVEPYERLLNSYTADDWLDETTDGVIVIPVSTIHTLEQAEGTYADMQDYLRTPLAVA